MCWKEHLRNMVSTLIIQGNLRYCLLIQAASSVSITIVYHTSQIFLAALWWTDFLFTSVWFLACCTVILSLRHLFQKSSISGVHQYAVYPSSPLVVYSSSLFMSSLSLYLSILSESYLHVLSKNSVIVHLKFYTLYIDSSYQYNLLVTIQSLIRNTSPSEARKMSGVVSIYLGYSLVVLFPTFNTKRSTLETISITYLSWSVGNTPSIPCIKIPNHHNCPLYTRENKLNKT